MKTVQKNLKLCYNLKKGGENMNENKKLALIRIYQTLLKKSSKKAPLSQEKICEILQNDYGLQVERRAVSRNLELLEQVGVEIVKTKQGVYLDGGVLSFDDLTIITDSLVSSRYAQEKDVLEIIEKLSNLTNAKAVLNAQNVVNVGKETPSLSSHVLFNVSQISEAIGRKTQLKFEYNKFGADKKLHKTSEQIVSPNKLVVHNHRYYLLAYQELKKRVFFCRVDKMTSVEILEKPSTDFKTLEGFENGVDYKAVSTQMPFIYTDMPTKVSFLCDGYLIDQVIDWFGFEIEIEKVKERYKITVEISPSAMEFWAMQYLSSVEILEPKDLREKVRTNLLNATQKYKK